MKPKTRLSHGKARRTTQELFWSGLREIEFGQGLSQQRDVCVKRPKARPALGPGSHTPSGVPQHRPSPCARWRGAATAGPARPAHPPQHAQQRRCW